jgi:Fic family protein
MQFKPNYTITDKILNKLTAIAAAREIIEQSHLVPLWEAKLRRQAILSNSHSSTAIEGNNLSFSQVEALSEGKDVSAEEKDKQEVLNYLEALEKIPALAEKGKFTIRDLLNIHKMITKGTLHNDSDCGVFRNRQVFVGRRVFNGTGFKEEVTYMPPKTEEVPVLVNEFIKWLDLENTYEMNPILLAGIVHYEIARIHPFIDGNGRTARLLATLVLYLSGFDHRRIFALDDYYDKGREAYYGALKTVDKETRDLTKWLEYFTDGVVSSIKAVKESILKLGLITKKGAQIALTPRQMQIVEYTNKNGSITNRGVRNIFKISNRAALDEINKLIGLKVLKSRGKGRSLHYILLV